MESLLRIGELAAETGVTAKTIRFYESAGVIPAPVRGRNGYRLYRREAADLLLFFEAVLSVGRPVSQAPTEPRAVEPAAS